MSSRAHLTPASTTDKNGKQMTVYRRSAQPAAVNRMASLPPASPAFPQVDFSPSISAMIDTKSTGSKDRATLRRAMIPSMTNKHVANDKRNRINALDRITLTLAASAVRKKLITGDQLEVISGMNNDEAREYVALASTVGNLDTYGKYLRMVYNGARPVNKDGYSYARIDLRSEESVSHYAAIMRFAVAFQESHANSLQRHESIYTERRVDSQPGNVLNEDLQDLVTRRPDDIDRIIELMDGSAVVHAAGLEHMLDTNSALSEGAL